MQVRLVRLVHLVRFQTDNFRYFLRQQTDKRQTVNGLRKFAWASVFRFPIVFVFCCKT